MQKVLCKLRNTLIRQGKGRQARLESESSTRRSVSQLMGVVGRGSLTCLLEGDLNQGEGAESPQGQIPAHSTVQLDSERLIL